MRSRIKFEKEKDMKLRNIIILLSALLCMLVLFAACDSSETETEAPTVTETETVTESESETVSETEETTALETEEPTEPETHEPLLESVAPDFDNFFELLEKETTDALSSAERVDKEIVDCDEESRFIIMMTKDVDTKNNVTVTYDVYNINEEEIVLTVEYDYYNGDYDTFDWENLLVKENIVLTEEYGYFVEKDVTAKYPEKVVEVTIEEVTEYDSYWGSYSVMNYILVKEAEITPVSDSDKEKNPEGCVYNIDISYKYYDVTGELIAKSNCPLDVSGYEGDEEIACVFGSTRAFFDSETYEILVLQSVDNEEMHLDYDYVAGKYGYFFDCSSNIANIGTVSWFDVYNVETNERIYRKYLEDNWHASSAFRLHNGNVLIQYMSIVSEDEDYDFYLAYNYYKYKHQIFDVLDGTLTDVEIPYIISDIAIHEDYEDEWGTIGLTENARNIAFAIDVNEVDIFGYDLVIFDNDMSVLYTLEKLVPEHKCGLDLADGDFNIVIDILETGDYLVKLDGVVANRAIVNADGTLRTYLKDDMEVVGKYIISETDKVVYDYDLNKLFDFGTIDEGYTYYGKLFGSMIFADQIVDEYDNVIGYTYLKLTEGSDGMLYTSILFDGENAIIGDSGDKYVVVYRDSDDKHVIYNENYEIILVTYNQVYVYDFVDGYAAFTNIDGHSVMYLLK